MPLPPDGCPAATQHANQPPPHLELGVRREELDIRQQPALVRRRLRERERGAHQRLKVRTHLVGVGRGAAAGRRGGGRGGRGGGGVIEEALQIT